MSTLAVALIVKNEQAKLARCLDSVREWADEIVLLDSGSTDETETIARKYTSKFYVNTDWQGFGKQRQRAEAYVESDFILWLDADEVVSQELKVSIGRAIEAHSEGSVYQLNRKNSAYGKTIDHSGWSPDWIVRLYKRGDAAYTDSLVHEKVAHQGPSVKLDGYLYHDTYENLHHHIRKSTHYIELWADEREGRKKGGLFSALTHAFWAFIRMFIFQKGFLDGRHGFVIAWMAMHSTFVKYMDLYFRDYVKRQQ
ncbi:glycosyltransferase family 2 protein [Vibrio agarivorans]